MPQVQVVNSSHIDLSAMFADRACGNGTKLIYYLSPGQILSRPFSPKDTHNPKGELIVAHEELDFVSGDNVVRSMAATAVLGFHSPSFTYDAEVVLPADTNEKFRKMLRSSASATRGDSQPGPDIEIDVLHKHLQAVNTSILDDRAFIPEVKV